MVTLDQIQSYMREQLDQDSDKGVSVSGDTLEDALEQASIELGLPIKKVEYEVLERGSRGMLGVGKKPWLLLAYPARERVDAAGEQEETRIDLSLLADEEEEQDRDGRVFVRMTPDGIMLKVTKPRGSGSKATERQAMEKLLERTDDGIDKGRVSKAVKLAQGEFIKVGDFEYDPSADASLSVELADGEMKAYLTAYPPGEGGADPSFDQVVSFLQMNGVVEGIDEAVIGNFVEDPLYRESVLVASGRPPKNGEDAQVRYSFDLDPSQITLKETDGRVDFKELNLVQNVVQGQVLARKEEAQRGEPGRTVTGKLLPATDGKDVEMPVGKNVRIAEDGKSAIAEINGQVVLSAGRITVEPVHVIAGDVNLRTGNVLFLGTVLVKGNVDDGFTVKAAGNIEVMGSVGRSNLDAEGDIIVHQGIAGRNASTVRCGRSLWAKFVENARVESGDLVVVSDGIMNCEMLADRKIICRGKRASIVGGQLKAVEEINAKTLGSVAGSETVLEVGYDPKRKEKLAALETTREEHQRKLDDLKLNMSTIENLVRSGRSVSEEKKSYYQELKEHKVALQGEVKKIDSQIQELRDYLGDLKVSGRISASGTVYPGVRISIKDAFLEVRNEFKAVTFVADKNTVKVTRYEESDEDVTIGRRV
ncbi:MAG: FapA family protein [Spirochaetota bacterium]